MKTTDNNISTVSELKKNDIVSIQYGYERLIAKVIGNNGGFITWYSLKWMESSARNFSYERCEADGMTKIGTYRSFWKRVFSFNYNKVDFMT